MIACHIYSSLPNKSVKWPISPRALWYISATIFTFTFVKYDWKFDDIAIIYAYGNCKSITYSLTIRSISLLLTVACWTTDHYHPSSILGVGISEGCFLFDFASLPLEVASPV